jgi:hypothetical protein
MYALLSSLMYSRYLPLVALLAALFLSSHVALAGAWTASKGSVYAKLTYGASSANTQFAFDAGTKPLVEGLDDYPFADRSMYLYTEYGFNDDLTLTAMLPYKRAFMHDKLFKYNTTGMADIAFGARYRLFTEGNWVGSASGSVSVPTGYHRDFQPSLGSGQMDFAAAFNIGRSFWPAPAYATGSVGYRYRSGIYTSAVSDKASSNPFFNSNVNYSDELFAMVEGGYTITLSGITKQLNGLLVHVVVNSLISMRGSGSAFTITSAPSTQRFLKLGGGAALGFLNNFELSGDFYTTPMGMNTVQSIDIFLGVGAHF